MRLLDDLGWREDDPRDSYALTISPDQLRGELGRCQATVETEMTELAGDLRHFDRDHEQSQRERAAAEHGLPVDELPSPAESAELDRALLDRLLATRQACVDVLTSLAER